MVAIVSLLLVVTVSIVITRVATVALTLTGLSRESARFQARSAFTGAGFTTGESENVVGHPVRRRVVMSLMLLGNAGIVTVVSSLVLGFVNSDGGAPPATRLSVLAGGLVLLWLVARSRAVDIVMSRVIARALKRFTKLDVRDYARLLHFAGGYSVLELAVREKDWVANRTLEELKLREEGVVVLGIERTDSTYVAAPIAETVVEPGDVLVLYGNEEVLASVDQRRADEEGDREHARFVEAHRRRVAREKRADDARRPERLQHQHEHADSQPPTLH